MINLDYELWPIWTDWLEEQEQETALLKFILDNQIAIQGYSFTYKEGKNPFLEKISYFYVSYWAHSAEDDPFNYNDRGDGIGDPYTEKEGKGYYIYY